MAQTGGVDRAHGPSFGPKFLSLFVHAGIVGVCLWLAFGGAEWADPRRARVLALCAALYFLRNVITLMVLLKRRMQMSEALGLAPFIAVFEIGFVLLGAGWLSGGATPWGWADWIGVGMVLLGSVLNTGSEVQRWAWKRKPASRGKCYTGGLFAYSQHINYFGDAVLFSGWALLTASLLAWSIPVIITASFVFYHIPALDAYLVERYGDDFRAYAARTAKFVPFLY